MFTHILVPLDGSPLAQSVLPYALALASATGAPITLLSVVPPAQMMNDYYLPYDAAEEAEGLARAGDALDDLARSLRSRSLRIATAVTVGDAADEIIRYGEENGVDAIVMASHGRGGAFHWAFGSVARKVITGATVPTLVVRAKEATAHPETPASIHSILVPLDGSELAEAVIPLATDLARSMGASVTLARIVPFPGGIYVGSPYTPLVAPDTFNEAMNAARTAARTYLFSIAEQVRRSDLSVEIVVRDGDPASHLLSLMDEEKYDLVVAATHGRTGAKRWVLGSVAERLVESSHTPVLLARSRATAASDDSDALLAGVHHNAANAAR
jgi:nucleotide-binding universal stress UspA family protein